MSSSAPRRSQQILAYPGNFATQSAFGTALATGDIDTLVSRDESDIEVEIILDQFEVLDCTGEFLARLLPLARSSRIAFSIYAEGETLFGWLGLAAGVVAGDVATLLPPREFQPPPTTLIYWCGDDNIKALKFKDMVCDSVVITGRTANRITARVQLRGHGGPEELTSYTPPDCSTVDPIFLKDGAFSLDNADRAADLRNFTFTLNNNLVFQEDPFPFNSADISRMERAERREWSLAATLSGATNDPTWKKAVSLTEGDNEVPYSLRIGGLDDGITVASVGDAIMRLTGVQGYDGQVARSTLPIRLDALRPSGQPSPITITRNVAESS